MGPFQSCHNSKHIVEKNAASDWNPILVQILANHVPIFPSLADFPLGENESQGHEELYGLSVWMHVRLHHYDN